MIDIKQLAAQLPLNRLAPALRARLEFELQDDREADAALPAAREAVAAFLRSGDLVKVALAGQNDRRHALYLVRGTSRLVDLTGLLPAPRREPPTDPATHPAAPDDPPPPLAGAAEPPFESMPARPSTGPSTDLPAPGAESTPDRLLAMIEAMEVAQRFPLGDPRSNDPGVVVDRIVGLLRGFTPGIALSVQLHGLDTVEEDAAHLIPAPQGTHRPFWLQHRQPGQALLIRDPGELPAVLRQAAADGAPPPALTVVAPLISPSDPQAEVGLLYAAAGPDWPAGRLLELARRLAAFVSSRWQCQQDVNRRVLTDSLTGIHNRAFFDSQFPLELERAARAGLPLTLVFGDLDHFKAINDVHGHQCGDLVLQGVARSLLATLRRIDHVCRIGGEEFACLLPSTSSVEAREVLSRLVGMPFRIQVPLDLGGAELAVTMSYGVVTFPDAGRNHGELRRKADRMLYRAKRLGRNRCCLWRPDGHHQLLLPLAPPPPAGD